MTPRHVGTARILLFRTLRIPKSKENLSLANKIDGLLVYPRLSPQRPSGRRQGVTSCTTYLSCKSLKERFLVCSSGVSLKADAKVVTFWATTKFFSHFFHKITIIFEFLDINQ
jgi:hypothetical protein